MNVIKRKAKKSHLKILKGPVIKRRKPGIVSAVYCAASSPQTHLDTASPCLLDDRTRQRTYNLAAHLHSDRCNQSSPWFYGLSCHRYGFHSHLRHKYLVSKRMSSRFVRYLPKLEKTPCQNMNCLFSNFLYSCFRSRRTQSYVVHTIGVQSQCDLRMHSVPIMSLPSFHRRLQINHALILRARRAITSA